MRVFESVPALKSPKIQQNRPKSPKLALHSAQNLQNNFGAYRARNIFGPGTIYGPKAQKNVLIVIDE
jgi:hypothetical protein